MANLKGAVPEFLNSEYLKNILRKLENCQDLQLLKMNISPGSSAEDGFVCQIFRILVHYKTINSEKQISLIGKYKVSTKLIKEIETVSDFFGTEVNFFKDMPDLFKKISKKSELDFLPKCIYLDLENNLILMEDLVALNYELQPRGRFLNKKQCTLVIKSLAAMHGASYEALKIEPNLKNKFTRYLYKDKTEGPLKSIIDNSLRCLKKCIKLYDLPSNLEDELLMLNEKLDANWFNVCDLNEDRLNFLIHGDVWMNNMMFHTSGDKVKLIDFQIYNYNCFANDLQFFLFTSASTDVIINDIDYLLENYYKKLRSVAPDIPNLTLDRIKKEFAERYFFGYTLVISFRPSLCSNTHPDLEKMVEGKDVPMGFDEETYIKQLPILMAFLEKVGAF